ncbi:ectonucleotide pyrophosphatase/phosphodiesterase [Aliidiomarina sp. Khilg15.8]
MRTLISQTLIAVCLLIVAGSSEASEQPVDLDSTVILISLDGFHPDYLERYSAPAINRLAQYGLKAEYLKPIFPTKTFPNHYALVTGLHAENHGIVDNGMFDPDSGRIFRMSDSSEVRDAYWWQDGEPIWVTAEKQGVTAGTFFFPGSDAPIQNTQATYWFNYDGDIGNRERVETVLGWLQKPADERPRMITLYMSDVDTAGHRYGPSSREVAQAVADVDAEIDYLVQQLDKLGMLGQVDIMLTSDHGMARVDQTKHMIIDQQFDTDLAKNVRYSRELVGIFPKDGQKERILEQLKNGLADQPVRIFRKSQMPARFHYQDHERIPPILVMAEEGWVFTREEWLDPMRSDDNYFRPRGSHGYDNNEESMQAIFIAHGPSFQQTETGPVSMVDLYNVMTTILNLEPATNDGDRDVLPRLLNEHTRK